MSPHSDLEQTEVTNQIFRITLNRPDKLNALNKSLLREIAGAFEAAEDYQVIIVEGAGESFTAGADLDEAQEEGEDVELFQNLTRAVYDFDGITIGKLHGWVVGGGFEWTLSFDLRYAAENTTFKMTESEIGVPISNAATMLLPLTVGIGRARELIFTSRELEADEAKEAGLVNEVYNQEALDDAVRDIATDLVEKKDETALRLNKRGVNAAFPVEDALEYEALLGEYASERSEQIDW